MATPQWQLPNGPSRCTTHQAIILEAFSMVTLEHERMFVKALAWMIEI
jgi:hypothetical protein